MSVSRETHALGAHRRWTAKAARAAGVTPGTRDAAPKLVGEDLVKRMRSSYTKVERLRPQATRKESTELFLIGLSKKPPP